MQVAKQQSPQWEDRFWISQDGLRLHYRDYAGPADRPPILMLHGLTRNARDFEEVAARHAGEWRVIVPDFRGRGLSDHDPMPSRYMPPTYAAEVLQLLDELGIDKAVFVGTSLGGLVTMAIGAMAPQRIAGAVLNDVGPVLDSRGLDRIRGYVGKAPVFSSWEEAAAAIAERHCDTFPGYGAAEWGRFARRVCREIPSGVIFDYDLAVAQAFNTSGPVAVIDGWPFFRALSNVPLLVVRGANSDLLAAEQAEAMVGEHPDAELVTVPEVGHAPDLSEPEAAAAIDRLLKRTLEAR